MSHDQRLAAERGLPGQPAKNQAFRGVFIRLRDCLRDRRGVGAVEFAILAPILIAVYFTCFELTIGFSFAKRATRAAGTIGDLVAQQKTVTPTFLATTVHAGKSIFVPYDPDRLTTAQKDAMTVKITGVTIDASGTAKVLWSWQQKGTAPYAVNAPVTVPKELRVPSTFLVRTELSAAYPLLMFLPTTFSSNTGTIAINREIFFQQRLREDITCNGC